ncbi:two-component sensor histidine kinase PhoR [Niallia circulans]|uniref:two-component system histidine kinase PnpS n=1 Tax=Niallia circulans TaxID=1397 RepID=UPI00077C799C|nr:ATP-binding protein [Niallia circulans]MDR4317308.1 HAMP domain-containing histidine kinase [Niallia circulans]MED3838800.1 ATP-binding protein [Niallia circulans]MED4245196.1 ATP-binding protein [Niallia circulans]MED4248655.1 ATP-binding protein [Niallia circulans]QKH62557.1 PAS domain-containing protein [Niallia circulans]
MKSFKSRLMASVLFTIFIVFLFVAIFIESYNKKTFMDSFDSRLKREGTLIANQIMQNGEGLDINNRLLQEYSEALDIQITVMDETGEILFNEGELQTDTEYENRMQRLLSNEKAKAVTINGNPNFHFYQQKLTGEEGRLGYLLIGAKIEEIENAYQHINWIIFASFFLSLLVIYLIGYKLIYRYIRPIESATKVAVDLANGNYHARTYEDRVDETGVLSSSLNKVAKDMQEMVKAQEIQEDRLGTLIESISSGLLLIDSRGYINLINKSYKDMFFVRSADYLYKQYYKVIPYRQVMDLAEEIFMTEHKVIREMTLEIKNEKKSFQVYGVPIIGTNDRWMGILLVFNDITELKKLEQIRKDFVANVSHELKTPITSIKGFSETLLDGAMEDKETLEEFLRIILKESHRLQTLIQDLLDLSKLEQHHFALNKEEFNLVEILNKATKMLKGRAEAKNIKLFFPQANEIIQIEGDRSRLTQVFLNLITNAVIYTPNDGEITVYVVEKKRKIEVKIQDTGIGIEQEEIPRIFERFYRVDKARSRNSGGTGLGLAIVKHLVELHRGTIQVESKMGEGTTFTVIFHKEFPF